MAVSVSSSKHFCNNCGKQNHTFSQCVEPITSIGVICIRYNSAINDYQYLMICRKDTLGFIDFMRGKYSVHNVTHLQDIVNEMTLDEKRRILEDDFDKLWDDIWHNNYGFKYRNEKEMSRTKFNNLRVGIVSSEHYCLKDLVDRSPTKWEVPEWEIPKGRRNFKERDIDTACREFEEETGISKDRLVMIHNVQPFDEVFTGSNYKSYRQRYFLAVLRGECSLENYQRCEVSDIKWINHTDITNVVRDYSLEKIKVLNNVNKLLKETVGLIF